jgi:hypothetical protein
MSKELELESNPLSDACKPKDNQSNYKKEEIFAKDHFLYLIVGRKRSGKTTLALNLLETPEKTGGLKKKFDAIWLISPTAENDPKMADLVEELKEDDRFWPEFNNEVQMDLMSRIKAFNTNWEKKKKPHHLVIYDDVMAFLPHNRKKGQAFNGFMTNQRHFKSSALILAQRLNELNPLIRSQADVVSYFRQDNPKEDKIFSETFGVPPELIHACTQEPHSFITANFLHTPPKFYKQFDEIQDIKQIK